MKKNQFTSFSGIAFLSLFFIIGNIKAECTYEKPLRAKEYPIGIRLSWSTASEQNTSIFILERVGDTNEFEPLSTLQGAKNSNAVVEYTFLDVRPMVNKTAYRLKQVDIDGTFSYSDVVTIERKLETNIMLVDLNNDNLNNACNFTLDALKEGDLKLKLVDSKGKTVWEGTKKLNNGLNELSVDFSSQPEGDYKIVAVMGRDEKVVGVRKIYDEIQNASNVAERKKAKKN